MSAHNHFRIVLGLALVLLAGCSDPPESGTDGGPREDAATATCVGGTTLCGEQCVDTDQARAHCGACDNACAAGQACVDGTCDVLCPASQTECDGICADTTTDRLHCGSCGSACAVGERCVSGACEVSCPEGQAVCGDVCADIQSDPAHCGECGSACPAGAVCSEGACTTSCGSGLTECSGACVDVQSAPEHCGACGTVCAGSVGVSGLCVAGACRSVCEPLIGDCNGDLGSPTGNGCETPLATDATNCGACGRSCEFPQAIAGCAAGACVFSGCDEGFDDCDGVLSNGCETELADSELHCGACGSVCGAGENCIEGVCAAPTGEDCTAPSPLSVGMNEIRWTASRSDYMTSADLFSCSTTQPEGVDVVLSYTATATALVTVAVTKPNTERWTMIGSTACGDLTTSVSCVSATGTTTTPITTLTTEPFVMAAGQTVYFHLTSTTASDVPLYNPLQVEVSVTPTACAPGVGGIVGTTVTARRPTSGFTSLTEYFVAADESPTGYVYVGGTSNLYRVPKAGGPTEDVEALAGLTTELGGYGMIVDGGDIYLLDSVTTGTTARMFRISRDGGATWIREDYAFFTTAPLDDFRAGVRHDDTFYLATHEGTASAGTQIWAVPAGVERPAVGTLALTIPNETNCSAIARDSMHFYLACATSSVFRLIRVPVAGGAAVLVTDDIDLNTTANAMAGDDTDGDGVFDVLYVHGDLNRISFVCSPGSATPVAAPLRVFDTGTTNYGMAFDSAAGVLWTYDDGTRELVSLE